MRVVMESCMDGLDQCMPKHDICSRQNSASRDDAGPSNQYRVTCPDGIDPCMPKHSIFLSHSGSQKNFTEHLWKELKRVNYNPFFDKDTDSLQKGEKFYPLLEMSAENCRVAILILSKEFFTSTKWPMMELTWFVKAQELGKPLKILPLFFEISREEMNNQEMEWPGIWEEWKRGDPRIDVEEWKKALKQIPGNNGIEYGGKSEGHVAFIEKVVKAVCILLPPDVLWDTYVQSSDQLSKPILERLAKVEPSDKYKVRVMGLYGMGGIGKTTISRVIYNQKHGEFCGKVCYIELGQDKNLNGLLKTVLRELTEWREVQERPIDEHDQLSRLLKQRMRWQKVFLILDNVWDDQIDEVKVYLNAGYDCDSMVLVTSRSLKILDQLGIRECDSMEMPELAQEGAVELFRFYAGMEPKEVNFEFVKRCIQECYFQKIQGDYFVQAMENTRFHYHPLALKVLGKYFGSIKSETSKWDEKLVKLKAHKKCMLQQKNHPIFSILRLGFDALGEKQQKIFLDLALIWKSKWSISKWSEVRFKWDWLCKIYREEELVMEENVNEFQRKGLLDSVHKIEELEYNIHDLYLEFAELVSQEGAIKKRRFLIDKCGNDVPHMIKDYPSNKKYWPSLDRLIIHNSKAQSLEITKMDFCTSVEVLDLYQCHELTEMNVSKMVKLRCVVVTGGCLSLVRWRGLKKLSNLIIFRSSLMTQKILNDLASLSSLQVLDLSGFHWIDEGMILLDLRCCVNLQDFIFSYGSRRYNALLIDNYLPISVLKIDYSHCPMRLGASPIKLMSSLTNLQDLNLGRCDEIEELTGLSELISLQKLNAQSTGIHELPIGMEKLKELQFLDVSWCNSLISIVGIAHVTALRRVDTFGCNNLSKLPDDFSSLQKLEMLDLRGNRLICELPRDFERLVGHSRNGRILKVGGCYGLIAPLVAKLRCPGESHVDMELCPCQHLESISMQSWIDARKNVNGAAYDLLKSIVSVKWLMHVVMEMGDKHFGNIIIHSRFLNVDDEELDDFTVRALCEYDNRRDRRDRFAEVLEEMKWCENRCWALVWGLGDDPFLLRCGVLATAPCTFGVLMKRAKLELLSEFVWKFENTHETMWESYLWNNGEDAITYRERTDLQYDAMIALWTHSIMLEDLEAAM